jgi:hypothetical protein
MYLYIIKREFEEIPFDRTKFSININGKLFDVLESNKNTALQSISDYVINLDNMIFEKSTMMEESQIKKEIEKEYGEMNTLILG